MKIDIENVEKLVEKADEIFIDPEGEKVLIKLLELQKQIEDAIDEAKRRLVEAGLKINPKLTSIQADHIKVYYRSYGSKYKIDESAISEIPENMYKVIKKYYANTKEIEAFISERGGLPVGIIETDRPKTLSFTIKK